MCTGPGWALHSEIVAPYLLNYGTEEQKQQYVHDERKGGHQTGPRKHCFVCLCVCVDVCLACLLWGGCFLPAFGDVLPAPAGSFRPWSRVTASAPLR